MDLLDHKKRVLDERDHRPMRLDGPTEAVDALQVLATRRREIPLSLVTERPLRKSPRMPWKIKARLREEVLGQIGEQLRESRRRAFRGHVAVDLELILPRGRHEAEMAPVVKEYLDVLSGPVYSDDAIIDHLMVTCSYADETVAKVLVRCIPVDLFAVRFDRSFRVADELGLHDPDARWATLPWGFQGFDHHDKEMLRYEEGVLAEVDRLDADEQAAFDEDEDEDFFPEVSEVYSELADPQLRETLGPELEKNIGLAIGRQLTDQGFDSRDRPGRPPGWLEQVVAGDFADIVHLPASHPGCFALPPPPERETEAGKLSWDRILRNWFSSKAGRPAHWGLALFGEPLVLDIAVRGGAAPRHDLDNLAHRVGAAFRAAYPAAGRLGGYRVYRVGRGDAEVRVRVLPAARLALLRRALDEAQELIIAERRERGRGLTRSVIAEPPLARTRDSFAALLRPPASRSS